MQTSQNSAVPQPLISLQSAVWYVDPTGRYHDNKSVASLFTQSGLDYRPGWSHTCFYSPEDQQRLKRCIADCLKAASETTDQTDDHELCRTLVILVANNGIELAQVEEYIIPIRDSDGQVNGCRCLVVNISDPLDRFGRLINPDTPTISDTAAGRPPAPKPQAITKTVQTNNLVEAHPIQVKAMLDSLPDAIYATDASGQRAVVNKQCRELEHRLLQTNKQMQVSVRAQLRKLEIQAVTEQRCVQEQLQLTVNGTAEYYLVTVTPENLFGGSTVTISEICGLKKTVAQTREISTTDKLTGLPDRQAMIQALNRQFDLAPLSDEPTMSLIHIKLGRLGEVDRLTGSVSTDQLLTLVAATLENTLRPEDLRGRWDRDCFVVGLGNSTTRGTETVAHRLREAFNKQRLLSANNLSLDAGISIGFAVKNSQTRHLNDLIVQSAQATTSLGELGQSDFASAVKPSLPKTIS